VVPKAINDRMLCAQVAFGRERTIEFDVCLSRHCRYRDQGVVESDQRSDHRRARHRSASSPFGMLRHSFNSHTEADLVESAVAKAISSGARTADIAMGGKFVSTIEMGDAIVSELAGLLPAVR
jgi:hypothetical protein